jgi:hypothetical protein
MADARRVAEAEAWFIAHGLPYFVDNLRDSVRARLSRPRLLLVLLVAIGLGVTAGIGTGLVADVDLGVATGGMVFLGVLVLYGLRALKAWLIARWALGQTFSSLGLLFPLATRALPMLLLFITFLFINTEFWQVASALRGGVLWATVMVFGALAAGFLWVRIDEELDAFDDDIDPDQLVATCRSTPFAEAAVELVDAGEDLALHAEVTGLQKANLVLVLLIAQFVQVFLLAVAVFGFFLLFGSVAISDSVITSWIGSDPHYLPGPELVSRELAQVSVFLAAFSGLYFSVYAVTDATYREQFFTAITRELEQAVSARVAYRRLKR